MEWLHRHLGEQKSLAKSAGVSVRRRCSAGDEQLGHHCEQARLAL